MSVVNVIGIKMVFQRVHLSLWMLWQCNAVGVEFSLRKHGYSKGIYDELRLESVTPTALKSVFFDAIFFVLQYDSMACHAEINFIHDIDSNDL